MAFSSQSKAIAAQRAGYLTAELTPVTVAQKKGDSIVVDTDEQPRETTLEALARLNPPSEWVGNCWARERCE